MATITPVAQNPQASDKYQVWKWEGVGGSDTCTPLTVGQYREVMVQSVSTNWNSKTITWKGTLIADGSSPMPVTDGQSASGLVHSADALDEVLQIPAVIQPIPSGSGGDAIDIYLLGKLY